MFVHSAHCNPMVHYLDWPEGPLTLKRRANVTLPVPKGWSSITRILLFDMFRTEKLTHLVSDLDVACFRGPVPMASVSFCSLESRLLVCPCLDHFWSWPQTETHAPTNMEVHKAPFQEESSLSTGDCALSCSEEVYQKVGA